MITTEEAERIDGDDVTMALHNALDNQERADFFIVWKMTRKR